MKLYETPDNRLPQGSAVYSVQTRKNLQLRAMTAPAMTAESKGTVVILNGRADFVERYFETMGELQKRGYHVAGFDWRGQGGSQRLLKDGLRGHIRSYREYDDDLRAVMDGVVTKNCPVNPVPPGFPVVFTGTVSNSGNITLSNVVLGI